ncbi:MAG TPA: DNA-binding protein, partial [Pseudonocardiaceae bacterium]|nr:DNA-binding protein [Pseudonocardiaceae bacterium]
MSGTSLADWLREQSETMLVELLRARPDLAIPAPADSTVLATRAGTRASVARACDGLDSFTLAVLDALVLTDADRSPVPPAALLSLLGEGIDAIALDAAVARLRAEAIAWDGSADGISVAPAAREVAGTYPAGLGPSAPTLGGVDLPPLLAKLDDKARRLLGTLAEGPPVGKTRDAGSVIPAHGRTPVQELLAAGLLIRRDAETVELPRQVGIALRGAHPLGAIRMTEPIPELRGIDSSTVDSVGAGEAAEFSRHLESLLNLWS